MLRQAEQGPEIVRFFTDMFDVLAIKVEETGEEFAVRVGGDRLRIEQGLPPDYDYLVPLKTSELSRMVSFAEDRSLSHFERWRILSVLFSPLTRETLKNPVMSNGILRIIARIENLIHVELVGPEVTHSTQHTLVFAGGQWLVLEGLQGKPKRHYKMTVEDSAEYQKQVFKAVKSNSILSWMRFSRWYVKWRQRVSATD